MLNIDIANCPPIGISCPALIIHLICIDDLRKSFVIEIRDSDQDLGTGVRFTEIETHLI